MRRDTAPLVFGVLISTLLAGTLVIAGLKAGITPGVSPLVILFAWGAFTRVVSRDGGTRFLNIAQVAGSAGMAVTSGVIFTAPLVQILYADKGLEVPPVDVPTLIVLSLGGALIGFGFVGLTTRRFLSDPSLPAPEARACETMIEAAAATPDKRPRLGRSLYLGLLASFVAPLLVHIGMAREHIYLYRGGEGERKVDVDLPFTPIYIGIGGLLTMGTGLLVFGGSFLRLIGDGLLAAIGPQTDLAAAFPSNSMRWVGGGAMTVCVAYSLVKFLGMKASAIQANNDDPTLLEVSPGRRTALFASVAAGVGIVVAWVISKDGLSAFSVSMSGAVLVMSMLMVTLGALLSLQIGSSASPVSGTIFVTTLVLCLVALALGRTEISDVVLLTPLVVGACVAVCTANDSSQDYKTMQLCKLPVQQGFLAQILGLLGGCIVVPIVLYVAHEAYTLGSPELTAPQGKMFATLIDGLLMQSDLPWAPIAVGVVLGALAVVMEMISSRAGLQLPSMALAVGIYLPPYLGVGILIGALFRRLGEGNIGRQRNESILAAAGLITGAALLELILGVMILFGFDMDRLQLFWEKGAEGLPEGARVLPALNVFGLLPSPVAAQVVIGLIGILGLGLLLFVNSRGGEEDGR